MAEIHVRYKLSDKGKEAALAAGRNAGRDQLIVLRSPGHVPPEAPADVIARVLGLVKPDVPADPPADLVAAVKGLTEATLLLAQVLDPSTTRNVVVEDASPELWGLAVSLAKTNDKGASTVAVGYDDESGYATVGYTILHDRRCDVFSPSPETERRWLDAPATAAVLLPAERDRRAALKILAAEADVRAALAATEYSERMGREKRDHRYERAVSFLKHNAAYADLPEVAALAALVAADDRTALLGTTKGWSHVTPEDVAQEAVNNAKRAAERAVKGAWIAAHGSEHLRLLFDRDMSFESEYERERLAFEHPGWQFGGETLSSSMSRQPTVAEFAYCDAVIAANPGAVMGWHDRKYVPVQKYMNRTIYLPAPAAEPTT
jgi:hypothetical protein